MDTYEEAQQLIDAENYGKAYFLLNQVVNNKTRSAEDRSDAINMLGVIATCYSLDLNEYDDESGLQYFQKAIEIYPKNIGALSNIINSFGNSSTQHKDSKCFVTAYDSLTNLLEEESTPNEVLLAELDQKKSLYNELLEEVK